MTENGHDPETVRERIIERIKEIYDPEIPVNIYELGLIYDVEVDDEGHAHVTMTLTSPNCFAAQFIPKEVETKVRATEGVRDAEVEVTFDPPWTKDRMSESARLELGFL